MEKNTKGKLLGIGILVLLLVSMIPMAATAAPPDKETKIREIAYKLDGCVFPTSGPYTVTCTVGEKVGRIVIGKIYTDDYGADTFDISVSFSKLLPNQLYDINPANQGNIDTNIGHRQCYQTSSLRRSRKRLRQSLIPSH